MSLVPALLAGLALWQGSGFADTPELDYEYRPLHAEGSVYRALARTSLLCGPTEFRVTAPRPYEATSFVIIDTGRPTPSGGEKVLCRSEPSGTCRVDFGDAIARQTLRVDASCSSLRDGSTARLSKSFSTLDTHPGGAATIIGAETLVERAYASANPPDQVTRLLRIERNEAGSGSGPFAYVDDFEADAIEVKVSGIPGARLVSMKPPDPAARKLVPILFNVSTFLTERRRRKKELVWRDSYRDMVSTLVQGLRNAARRGVDVEYLVVPYAADGRLFGPIRLHSGGRLDAAARRENDSTLRALERFLGLPPPASWNEKRLDRWADNFGSVLQTLNDLYLRSYDGLVQGIWITGGWHNPSERRATFQEELWPERVAELNPEWDDTELSTLLERLDRGQSAHDDEVVRWITTQGSDGEGAVGRVASFLRQVDPGATGSLHPHRVDSSPMLNVVLVPSDRSLRGDRMAAFANFVTEQYGGMVFRLLKLDKSLAEEREAALHADDLVSGTGTLTDVLVLTHAQLCNSYVVEVEVPNPRQDGGRHDLRFELRRDHEAALPEAGGWDLAYMPYYTSSHTVRKRLVSYLASPYKELRLLSAYELRNRWADEELYAACLDRWRSERDDQIRRVLFESWVAVNLKRLQTRGSAEAEKRAAKLSRSALSNLIGLGDNADRLPDPTLAREAASVAEWYRDKAD